MRQRLVRLLFLLWVGQGGMAAAQPLVFEVRDLNLNVVPDNAPANLSAPVDSGRILYFTAEDPLHGVELWRTDKTGAASRVVKDLVAGSDSSFPSLLTPVQGRLFFASRRTTPVGVPGRFPSRTETLLWGTDGTPGGTVRLAATPGVLPQRWVVVLGEDVVFVRQVGAEHELWRSDGTLEGTRRLVGLGSLRPVELLPAGPLLFLLGVDQGLRLWRSDGTSQGTFPVTDVRPQTSAGFAVLEDELLFVAEDAEHGVELWRSDGTVAGTEVAVDRAPGPESSFPTVGPVFGGRAYVFAGNCGGECVFKTDGTPGGTVPAPELAPPGVERPHDFAVARGQLFFVAHRPGGVSQEVWVTDGTVAGTRRVWTGRYRRRLATLGEKFLYQERANLEGSQVWVSDGTVAGTFALEGFVTVEAASTVEDRVFLSDGEGIWVSDGTSGNTRPFLTAQPTPGSSNPSALTPFGDAVFFTAADGMTVFNGGVRDPALWKSDGTAEGTVPVVEDFFAQELVAVDDRLFAASVHRLWGTDGTAAGSGELPVGEPYIKELTPVGENLLFRTRPDFGQRLWRTDGTVTGTSLLMDLNPGYANLCGPGACAPPPSFPRSLTPLPPSRQEVLFVALDEVPQLWRSDATVQGTLSIKSFAVGSGSPTNKYPRELVGLNDVVLFVAFEEETGWELWRSDGSAAGTRPVLDLVTGPGSSRPHGLTQVGSVVYFAVEPQSDHFELWRSDGSAAGTRRIKALQDVEPRLAPGKAVALGNRLFFAASHESTGEELWVSDGSAAGTTLVQDIQPGPLGSSPQSIAAVDSKAGDAIVFAADDGLRGLEPWRSDGSAEGTFRVRDLAPGPAPSSPSAFTPVGPLVFFAADADQHGRELFAFHRSAPQRPPCQSHELCLGQDRFRVTVSWRDFAGNTGQGVPVTTESDDSGLFWFFHENNWEMLVKVVDGCGFNGHHWVFAAATTNVEYTLFVEDTLSGQRGRYFNPLGQSSPAVTDTGTFPCSPSPIRQPLPSRVVTELPGVLVENRAVDASDATRDSSSILCRETPSVACLLDERFEVEVEWEDFAGETGIGRVVLFATPDSGLFWFFSPHNWEMLVKVVDGCAFNDRYWVFAAATTNVGYTLRVTDTLQGQTQVYENPLGRTSAAVTDAAAFATCP